MRRPEVWVYALSCYSGTFPNVALQRLGIEVCIAHSHTPHTNFVLLSPPLSYVYSLLHTCSNSTTTAQHSIALLLNEKKSIIFPCEKWHRVKTRAVAVVRAHLQHATGLILPSYFSPRHHPRSTVHKCPGISYPKFIRTPLIMNDGTRETEKRQEPARNIFQSKILVCPVLLTRSSAEGLFTGGALVCLVSVEFLAPIFSIC